MTDLTERIRSLLLEAAIQAYEDAGMRGLCTEGRRRRRRDTLVDVRPALHDLPGAPGAAPPRR